jgi:hypothetical protein
MKHNIKHRVEIKEAKEKERGAEQSTRKRINKELSAQLLVGLEKRAAHMGTVSEVNVKTILWLHDF